MLIAIQGVKLCAHGMKLYAHTDTWSEALCAFLYLE